LLSFSQKCAELVNVDSSNISASKDKETVTFCGVVSGIKEVTTRKKESMAYVTIEDLKGSITAIFFADIYRKGFTLIHGEEPLLIRGTIDAGEEGVKVIASEVSALVEEMNKPFQAVRFLVDVAKSSTDDFVKLHQLLQQHRGKSEGYIHLMDDNSEVVIYLGNECRVDLSDLLKEGAERILGKGSTHYF
jgi:DNA polymerase-3 subunit alpha